MGQFFHDDGTRMFLTRKAQTGRRPPALLYAFCAALFNPKPHLNRIANFYGHALM